MTHKGAIGLMAATLLAITTELLGSRTDHAVSDSFVLISHLKSPDIGLIRAC